MLTQCLVIGGHAKRQVPREDSIPIDSHVDKCHGGLWHRRKLPFYLRECDEVRYSCHLKVHKILTRPTECCVRTRKA